MMHIYASEIRIEGDHIVIKSDDGNIIDTDNLQIEEEIINNKDISIDKDGLCIGCVVNKAGESKNIKRSTKLENVTIINDQNGVIINKKENK